jgi:predicted transcriptional regulator
MRSVLDGPGDRQAVLQHFADGLDAADAEVLRAVLERGSGGASG